MPFSKHRYSEQEVENAYEERFVYVIAVSRMANYFAKG